MKKYTLPFLLCFITLTTWSQEKNLSLVIETNVLPYFFVPVPVASMIGIEHGLNKTNKRWTMIHGLFFNYRNGDGKAIGMMNKIALGSESKKRFFEPAIGVVTAYRWSKSEGVDREDFESQKLVIFPVLDLMYKSTFAENRGYFKIGISSWIHPIFEHSIKNDFVNSNDYDGPILRPSILLGLGYKI